MTIKLSKVYFFTFKRLQNYVVFKESIALKTKHNDALNMASNSG